MDWKGKPDASLTAASHEAGKNWNAGLHVKILDYGDDAGVASAPGVDARVLRREVGRQAGPEAGEGAARLLCGTSTATSWA